MKQRPIRIVHLIDGLTIGGAEMMLYKLVSRMDRQRFDSHVVTFLDEGPVGALISASGIPVSALGMRRGRPSLPGLAAMLRIIRRLQPDMLQTWMYSANLVGALTVGLLGSPILAWNIRNVRREPGTDSRLSTLIQRACIRCSARPRLVIANSEVGRTDHIDMGYRARHWEVVPNGFDLERFTPDPTARLALRAELGLDPATRIIGIAARFHPQKDFPCFLRAAQILHNRRPDVHFLLAGHGLESTNTELAPLLTAGQLSSVTHLLGERADTNRLMAALDIFSLSSVIEGFPNVIGEAMSCGTPCVVTSAGDSGVIVGDTGIVVPPKQPEALADGWERLLAGGEDYRRTLGAAARERIRERYSLDAIVRQYQDLYLSLVGRLA